MGCIPVFRLVSCVAAVLLFGAEAFAATSVHLLHSTSKPISAARAQLHGSRTTEPRMWGAHFGYYTNFGTTSALTSEGTSVKGGDAGPTAATSKGTISFWIRGAPGSPSATGTNVNDGDILANQGGAGFSSEGLPGFDISFDNASGHYGTLRVNLGDASANAGNANGPHSCNWSSSGSVLAGGVWSHFLISFDVSGTTSTSKNLAVYENGVKLGGGCKYGLTAAMLVAVDDPNGWNVEAPIASNQHGVIDISDVVVDFTNAIVDSNNNISPDEIAKVYSISQPVPLPKRCALWGSTPQICLSGRIDKFVTNKGTATGLSLSGANDGQLYNTSFGPGGAPRHTAVLNWSYGQTISNGVTSVMTNDAGNLVNAGELLIVILTIEDSPGGAVDHDPACASGFAPIAYATGANPSLDNGGHPTQVLSCSKITDGTETGAFTFNWTTGNTRGGQYAIYDIGQVKTAAPIDEADIQISSSPTTNIVAPSLDGLTGTKDTLLTHYTTYDPLKVTVPAGQALAVGSLVSSGTTAIRGAFEYLTTSSPTGSRTATTPTETEGQAINIAIQPDR
jgi:hypothetical protein